LQVLFDDWQAFLHAYLQKDEPVVILRLNMTVALRKKLFYSSSSSAFLKHKPLPR